MDGAVSPGTNILLADDEESVRGFVDRVLKRAGYRVLSARDGQEALEMASALSGPLHLLITDLKMPDLDGISLARRLREVRPEARVILMSAYFDSPLGPHEGWTFVQKPFRVNELLETVRGVLQEPPKTLADVPELDPPAAS